MLIAMMAFCFQDSFCRTSCWNTFTSFKTCNYDEAQKGAFCQVNNKGYILSKGVLGDLGYYFFKNLTVDSNYFFQYENTNIWSINEILIILVDLDGKEEIVRARKTNSVFYVYDKNVDRLSKSPLDRNENFIPAILTEKQNKKLSKKIKLSSLGKMLIANKNWYLNTSYGCQILLTNKKALFENKSKGETIKRKLIAYGVSPNKITTNYCPRPYTNSKLINFQSVKILITIPKNELEEMGVSANFDINSIKKNGIEFKIQLIKSKEPIYMAPVNFYGIENINEYKEGNKYIYVSGSTNDYDYARDVLLSDFKRNGFDNAYIVAFSNGEKIPVSIALSAQNKE